MCGDDEGGLTTSADPSAWDGETRRGDEGELSTPEMVGGGAESSDGETWRGDEGDEVTFWEMVGGIAEPIVGVPDPSAWDGEIWGGDSRGGGITEPVAGVPDPSAWDGEMWGGDEGDKLTSWESVGCIAEPLAGGGEARRGDEGGLTSDEMKVAGVPDPSAPDGEMWRGDEGDKVTSWDFLLNDENDIEHDINYVELNEIWKSKHWLIEKTHNAEQKLNTVS